MGLIWIGLRLSFLGQMLKPFLLSCLKKWLLGAKMAKIVTNGGPRKHLIRAFRLSKEWGPPHEPGKTKGEIL